MYELSARVTISSVQAQNMGTEDGPREHRRTVLVVEDQALLRFLAADMLEDAGYNIILAATAEEAMTVLERGEQVDLLFSDINMPGRLDGVDLAEMINAHWPHIGVVLTSGAFLRGERPLPEKMKFLAKPYEWEDVYQALEQVRS